MSYGVMKRQLGVPAVTGFTWNESGGTVGSRSVDAEDWYIDSSIVRKLNKIWRGKYPELNISKFNDSNYNLMVKLSKELDDYYRDEARKQKGIDLEVPYEEYAAMWVQALKDKEELGLNENKEDDVKEQMYIDDEEFEMEMGRSKKDSLKKEMMIHVDQLMDGNIDMNDFMNVVEDIMGDLK